MKADSTNCSEVRFKGESAVLKDLHDRFIKAKVNVKPLFQRTYHAREPTVTSLIVALGGAAITKGIADVIKTYLEIRAKDQINRRKLRYQLIKDNKEVESGKINELLDMLDK